MNRFFTNLQKQVKDRSTVIFGGAQSPTGSVSHPGSEKRPDDEDDEELVISEAIEQALKTRSRGILKHIACLSPEAYSDVKELRVWSSTFNVNGDKPQPDQDFRSWLVHPGDKWPERSGETANWTGPDILFVGFQEINALNAISLVAGAGMENIDAWNTCIDCALNCKAMPEGYTAAQSAIDGLTSFTGEESPRHRNFGFGVQVVKENPPDSEQYVHIGGRNLVGLYLSVWVRKTLLPHISSWQAGEVRTGTMGFGNKGAVMVRLRVFDEPLCCICAHIASGESAADALKRQADFLQICKTAAFTEPSIDNPNYMVHEPLEHDIMQGEWTRSDLASQQPTVIFLGDFNFRIQGMPDAEVRSAVHSRSLDKILARDELAPAIDPAAAAEGKAGVFAGWREGFISFPPTFKYAKGSDRYVGDPLPDGADAAVSEGPGRTLSGFSEGPGTLDAASAATEAPSSSNAAAPGAQAAGAEDESTPAPPAEDGAAEVEEEAEAVGSHKVNLEGESPDATARSSPKAVGESQVENLDSAGAELDIAQSPGGSNTGAEDTIEDGPADKDGTAGPPSAGGSVIGRVQSTLGRQSSMSQSTAAPATIPRERVRTPAWCDRILYRCELRGKLAQLLYDRSELAISDHKPVMSAFLLNAESIDPERLAHESDNAQKSLDLLANNAQPRCTVGENVLEVGELGYGEVVTRSVSLTCTGEVPAQWKLTAPPGMELPDSSGPNIPPWVSIAPLSGMLTPGQTVEITFRIGVPDSSAATGSDPATAEKVVRRADTPGSLSHMCVLHIENGADHFVLVEGTYRASFFGLTISTLSEREASMAEEDLDACECSGDNMKHIFASPFVTHQWAAIPQPLKKMLHFLSRDNCLVTPGIFSESFQMIRSEAQPDEVSAALNTEQPGRLPVVATVQAALDAGEKVPEEATAHDVAATVLSYFKALPHPFFPESISAVCSASRPDANKAATTLKEALGGGAEWAVLCCTMRLLKLVIKVQADATDESLQERAKATFGGKVPTVSQRRSAIRSQLASCFADVWFPPINLEELDENATADDYARLLQQAADASAKQAQFLQMFLISRI